jgi:hypothetical protein
MTEPWWAFVEDQPNEAKAFAEQLGTGQQAIAVEVLDPLKAREDILTGKVVPLGVLMDVDLSGVKGEHGTGLGIAQDIRGKQKAREIRDYPIVRLAGPKPVERIIGGDPSSDDLFDLRISKNEVAKDFSSVQVRLTGVKCVYDQLSGFAALDDQALGAILGLTSQQREEWSHPALHRRLADGRHTAVHVAAGTLMRGLLLSPGLLIDEILLAVRLGLDREGSGEAWGQLLQRLTNLKFSGTAHEEFERWWARGLEDWWLGISGGNSLASLTISQRHERVCNHFRLNGLLPLTMPKGSAGERPWRLCTPSLEADEPQYVPIDPSESVRVTPRVDQPPWVDPQYAALGSALRAEVDDKRLNPSDLDRLRRKYRRI